MAENDLGLAADLPFAVQLLVESPLPLSPSRSAASLCKPVLSSARGRVSQWVIPEPETPMLGSARFHHIEFHVQSARRQLVLAQLAPIPT